MYSINSELKQVSSIERHQLYSLIPQEFQLYGNSHFKKTIDFYKPDQCIWNNPHRTSKKLYKYYHQQNKNYRDTKGKLIQMLQDKDRQNKQQCRIRNIIQKRDQTRIKFYSKRLQNSHLNKISQSKVSKMLSQQCLTQTKPNIQYQSRSYLNKISSKSLKQEQKYVKNDLTLTINKFNKQQKCCNQKSFIQSLKKSDNEKLKIIKIVNIQKQNMYKKTRELFTQQKQLAWKKNQKLRNSQISLRKLNLIR